MCSTHRDRHQHWDCHGHGADHFSQRHGQRHRHWHERHRIDHRWKWSIDHKANRHGNGDRNRHSYSGSLDGYVHVTGNRDGYRYEHVHRNKRDETRRLEWQGNGYAHGDSKRHRRGFYVSDGMQSSIVDYRFLLSGRRLGG